MCLMGEVMIGFKSLVVFAVILQLSWARASEHSTETVVEDFISKVISVAYVDEESQKVRDKIVQREVLLGEYGAYSVELQKFNRGNFWNREWVCTPYLTLLPRFDWNLGKIDLTREFRLATLGQELSNEECDALVYDLIGASDDEPIRIRIQSGHAEVIR